MFRYFIFHLFAAARINNFRPTTTRQQLSANNYPPTTTDKQAGLFKSKVFLLLYL